MSGILTAMPELALNTSATMTMMTILFSGKNQLAMNLDADMSLNGNPMSDISYPKKKNQKDKLTNKAMMDPINVNAHPTLCIIYTQLYGCSDSIFLIQHVTWYYHYH